MNKTSIYVDNHDIENVFTVCSINSLGNWEKRSLRVVRVNESILFILKTTNIEIELDAFFLNLVLPQKTRTTQNRTNMRDFSVNVYYVWQKGCLENYLAKWKCKFMADIEILIFFKLVGLWKHTQFVNIQAISSYSCRRNENLLNSFCYCMNDVCKTTISFL